MSEQSLRGHTARFKNFRKKKESSGVNSIVRTLGSQPGVLCPTLTLLSM